MATANTNFGSSCTAKARPKKTLKSTEPTSWPGFRRAASYSGGLDRLIKQQHQFRKSASTLPKLPSLERALLPLCRGAPTI
ncbi:hypothetical protein ACQRIU_004750 [Beauveria bassiana]